MPISDSIVAIEKLYASWVFDVDDLDDELVRGDGYTRRLAFSHSAFESYASEWQLFATE